MTGAYRYYSTDLYGSVRRIRNDAKASLGTYEYEPYGAAYYASGLPINFGFTGQQFDPNTGMYYFLFRHYSPATARWLTREPLGLDGPNLYHYGFGNPMSGWDIMGLWFRPVDSAVDWLWNSHGGGAVVGVVGAVVGITGGAIVLTTTSPAWFAVGIGLVVVGGAAALHGLGTFKSTAHSQIGNGTKMEIDQFKKMNDAGIDRCGFEQKQQKR